ncbi:glycosyltransferase family 4 protein [Clostridium algidicarnis]|nr:glycosyltransferase family 4 protein [Clostridium algidicarnis]MBU3205217.1 glycosyltransferase family 4 protein [Clostridium algidicarnis]MBU3213370.1 glycosyltransferase family 4 protein [Clostridium algidicarnis]MBU3223313.1 glycosyltransferase family 4 protein [Clostridium algidicarnis]
MEDTNQRGIYTDLVRELANKGVNMYVVSPRQKRDELPTELSKQGNINILKVKTGNITSTKSFVEKGISTLKIEEQYLNAIKGNFKGIQFDMIMYSTPPITFNKIIRYYKKHHNSKTYLVLKDIFPQNAVDIGLMKKDGVLYKVFRNKEINLYKNSDTIGCMSNGNLDYILEHNKYIDKDKVEIFPNAIEPISRKGNIEKDKEILEKYNISQDDTLFVYGGNLGKPQGIDFLLKVVNEFHKVDNGHLLIVGSGTEFNKINNHIENIKPKRVSIFERLPKKEYDKLIGCADVGLIFLDHRFTIPNFPSRLTSYMENSLPILASTDSNTDIKDVLLESGSGFWCESTDVDEFIKYAQKLSIDKVVRQDMGLNGRKYLEQHYDIRETVNILLNHLEGDAKNV